MTRNPNRGMEKIPSRAPSEVVTGGRPDKGSTISDYVKSDAESPSVEWKDKPAESE